jgi:hypothetical protein
VVVTPITPEVAVFAYPDSMPLPDPNEAVPPRAARPTTLSWDDRAIARAKTDEDGMVSFGSLQPGYYDVGITEGDRGISSFVDVCAGDVNEQEFDIEPGTTISGRVYLPDGKVKSDATVGLIRGKDDGEPGESFSGAGLNGSYEFRGIPAGTYFLAVNAYPSDPFQSLLQKIVVDDGTPKLKVDIFLLPK